MKGWKSVACEQAFGRGAGKFPSHSSLFFFPNTEPVHRLGNLSVRSGKNGPRVLTDAFYGCGKVILERQ